MHSQGYVDAVALELCRTTLDHISHNCWENQHVLILACEDYSRYAISQ